MATVIAVTRGMTQEWWNSGVAKALALLQKMVHNCHHPFERVWRYCYLFYHGGVSVSGETSFGEYVRNT